MADCFVVGRNPPAKYKGNMQKYNIGRLIGLEYAAFHCIPYARRPTGMGRFQAPEPIPTSSHELVDMNEISSQSLPIGNLHDSDHQFLEMDISDCLYLSIFLPEHPDSINVLLPVLVFIHGAGFDGECKYHKRCTPDSVIQHGVVFVAIYYRQGHFGFLNLRNKDYPGNVGLKDQVMALEWIRDNIECFKGDPKNVTLSGFGAGATCVNFHLISPASEDLFHKAIVQSGGFFCPWGYRGHYMEQKRVLSNDPEFRRLSDSQTESNALYAHVDQLLKHDRTKRHPQSLSPVFGPSVEKFAEKAFITDELEEMMKNVKHNKPVIAGMTKEEGIYFFFLHPDANCAKLVNEHDLFLQFLMDNFRWPRRTAEMCIDVIRDRYFPGRLTMDRLTMKINFAKFVSDTSCRRFYDSFKFGPERDVHKNLYVYRFDHFSEICAASTRNIIPFHEPTHGDEMSYLYCPEIMKISLGDFIYQGPSQNIEIGIVMDHICTLWVNFCKTGIPKSDVSQNIIWQRHTDDAPCYLSISTNLELKEEVLFQNELTWWLNDLVNAQPSIVSLASTPEETDEE